MAENRGSDERWLNGAAAAAIGWTAYKWSVGCQYLMKVRESGSAVQVFDRTMKGTKAIFRIDRPHKGMPFDHLNINPKPAGLKADPHCWLPSGTADASTKIATGLEKINTYIEPLATGLTLIEFGKAIYQDYTEGTFKHTTEATVRTAASAGAGSFGASAGAAIGTMLLPGIGTIAGGFAGAIGSSITASHFATKAVEENYEKGAEIAQKYGPQIVEKMYAFTATAKEKEIRT